MPQSFINALFYFNHTTLLKNFIMRSAKQYQKLDIGIHPEVYIDIDWYISMFILKISLHREENKWEYSLCFEDKTILYINYVNRKIWLIDILNYLLISMPFI